MQPRQVEIGRRRGGLPLTVVVAFVLLGFGALKLAESIADRSFEGVGGIIIGSALLLPGAIHILRRERPSLVVSGIGLLLVLGGVFQLAIGDIPWEAVLLLAAGLWLLLASARRC